MLFSITPSEMNMPWNPSVAVVFAVQVERTPLCAFCCSKSVKRRVYRTFIVPVAWFINTSGSNQSVFKFEPELLKLKQSVKKFLSFFNFSAESLRYQASNCPICRSRKWCSFIDWKRNSSSVSSWFLAWCGNVWVLKLFLSQSSSLVSTHKARICCFCLGMNVRKFFCCTRNYVFLWTVCSLLWIKLLVIIRGNNF